MIQSCQIDRIVKQLLKSYPVPDRPGDHLTYVAHIKKRDRDSRGSLFARPHIVIFPSPLITNAPVGHFTIHVLHPMQNPTLLAIPLNRLIINLSISE